MAHGLRTEGFGEKVKERIPEIDLSYLMMGSIAPPIRENLMRPIGAIILQKK